MELLDEQPKGKQDFDQWISNGVVLSKGKELKLLHHLCFVYLQYIHQQIIIFFFISYLFLVLQSFMFNSIPMEMTEENASKPKQSNSKKSINDVPNDKAVEDRIKSLLWYLRRYGVPEAYLFEVRELQEMTNIPKVTRCIAMLGKMVRNYAFLILNWSRQNARL